jgi:hypothetical protein
VTSPHGGQGHIWPSMWAPLDRGTVPSRSTRPSHALLTERRTYPGVSTLRTSPAFPTVAVTRAWSTRVRWSGSTGEPDGLQT